MRRRAAIQHGDFIKLRGVVCIVEKITWRNRHYSLEMRCGATIKDEPERNLRAPRRHVTCLACLQE